MRTPRTLLAALLIGGLAFTAPDPATSQAQDPPADGGTAATESDATPVSGTDSTGTPPPGTSTPDTSTPDTSTPDATTPGTSTPETSTPETSTPQTDSTVIPIETDQEKLKKFCANEENQSLQMCQDLAE